MTSPMPWNDPDKNPVSFDVLSIYPSIPTWMDSYGVTVRTVDGIEYFETKIATVEFQLYRNEAERLVELLSKALAASGTTLPTK
jgi:hypothetical protein